MKTPALCQLIDHAPIETALESARELAELKERVREQERLIAAMGDKLRIVAESLTRYAEAGL